MSAHLFKFLIILSILGSIMFLPAQSGSLASTQATITVTTLDDENNNDGDCSLREAILSANLNSSRDQCGAGEMIATDTITFAVSGTIMMVEDLDRFSITSSGPLVINGGGAITINAGDKIRLFSVNSVGNLTLEGLTLEDGYAAGGSGGAITNEGTLEISNSTLSSCSASLNGGAIYNDGNLTITGSNFSGNTASSSGGAVFNDSYGTLTFMDTTLKNNTAGSTGGAIYSRRPATIDESIISGNESRSSGGGIFNYSTMTITGSTISGNQAVSGGGIDNTGTLTLINSFVSDNSVDGKGGGIYNDDELTISGSTLSGNSAGDEGGGIFNYSSGVLDLSGSTLSDNSTEVYGGGISNWGTLTLINSTLSANQATNLGGGLFNDLGSLTITNSTFYGNSTVLSGGGGAINNNGIASMEGSIVAGSTKGGNCAGDPLTDNGYNLEDTDTCGFLGTNDSMIYTDPLPGPLQDNGGPSWTHALLPGSPAIDVAGYTTCPATDQRGVPRPLNGDWAGGATCDIGSYEVGMFVMPLSQTDTLSPGTTGDYEFTLYNYTNLTDTYALTSDADNWVTDVLPEEIGPLAPGESMTFTLSISVPFTAKVGATRIAITFVTSNAEPDVYAATAQVEIEVGPWHYYLPMIARTE